MAQVIWTDRALSGLEGVVTYVSDFRPLAAVNLARRIKAAGNSLQDDPARGRRIGQNRRELTVVYPYLIRYRIKGDTVTILEVRHGARRPPKSSGLGEEASIFDIEDEEAGARREAEAEADVAAGRVFGNEAVARWLESWGTPNQLPPPQVGG